MKKSRYDQISYQDADPFLARRTVSPSTIPASRVSRTGDRVFLVWPNIDHRDTKSVTEIDITSWTAYPRIWKAFASSALRIWDQNTERTKRTALYDIERGLLSFLSDNALNDIALEDINPELLSRFSSWLDSQKNSQTGTLHSPNTKRKRFGFARSIIVDLQGKNLGVPRFSIRRNLWPEAHKQTVHTTPLTDQTMSSLYLAALQEIHETVTAYRWARRAIASNTQCAQSILSSREIKRAPLKASLGLTLSIINIKYQGVIPPIDEIQNDSSALRNSIAADHGGYKRIEPMFYPTTRTWIPFFIILQIFFATNTETLLSAQLNDFRLVNILGQRRIHFTPEKKRSKSTIQRSSYPAIWKRDNPYYIYRFLIEWSKRIRPTAHLAHASALWLSVPRLTPKKSHRTELRAIQPTLTAHKSTIDNALKNFLERHGLPYLQFRQIRPTALEIVDRLTGGDIRAISAFAGHRSVQVTDRHYTSAAAARRDDYAVSLVENDRHRWLETGGKRHARERHKEDDCSAVTPGWRCLDPYDSPRPGATKGKLCAAYGECPLCPLATTDTTSSHDLARQLQFREQVVETLGEVSPERWSNHYRQVLHKLDTVWLPAFSDSAVVKDASALNLSPLPPLE